MPITINPDILVPKIAPRGSYSLELYTMIEGRETLIEAEIYTTATECAFGFINSFRKHISTEFACSYFYTFYTNVEGDIEEEVENERSDDETVIASLLNSALNSILAVRARAELPPDSRLTSATVQLIGGFEWIVRWRPN